MLKKNPQHSNCLCFLFFLALFLVAEGSSAYGAEAAPQAVPSLRLAEPQKALLWAHGAWLQVTEKAPVVTEGERSVLHFLLPADAQGMQFSVPGHTVISWSSVPEALPGGQSLQDSLRERQSALRGQLEMVKNNLRLWKSRKPVAKLDWEQQQQRMQVEIPALVAQEARLMEEMQVVAAQLKALPVLSPLGQRVSLVLQNRVTAAELPLQYSYTVDSCGWEPVYHFDAQPAQTGAKSGKDSIRVRLAAEVWQHTGMDWRHTAITLVNGGQGPREPRPVPDWIVESDPEQDVRVLSAVADEQAPRRMSSAPRPAQALVNEDSSTLQARWVVSTPGLVQGKSHLVLHEERWDTELQWLARPNRHESRVWLQARQALSAERIWPEGRAHFSIDGQSMGHGRFAPRGQEAELFFGADPRVQVLTTEDDRQHGESGVFSKSRTWHWQWTYTVVNNHAKAITVRVERPAPQLVDKDVTLAYDNAPTAQEDKEKKLLFWPVKVEAGGKASVRHGVTITSPRDLPLRPYAP